MDIFDVKSGDTHNYQRAFTRWNNWQIVIRWNLPRVLCKIWFAGDENETKYTALYNVYCRPQMSNFITSFEHVQIWETCALTYRTPSNFPHALTLQNRISSYNFRVLWTSIACIIFCIVLSSVTGAQRMEYLASPMFNFSFRHSLVFIGFTERREDWKWEVILYPVANTELYFHERRDGYKQTDQYSSAPWYK